MHIILPHIEPHFKLSTPKIRQPALNRVELTILLLFEPLIEHPLFEFAIKDESLRVPLGKKLRDLSVLLNQHQWIASKFKPES